MVTTIEKFAFVDAVHASEYLGITQDDLLDLIGEGRLRPFGGKASNPFLRSVDIVALGQKMGVPVDQATKRTKSPSARVQTRLTADARWADISEADLRSWVDRADRIRRSAAQAAVDVARQRLDVLESMLKDASESTPDSQG